MKSKLVEKQKNNYPCLKECIRGSKEKMIVLFTEPKTGVVVYSTWDFGNSVGHYSNGWMEEEFHIYNGEVTLSNDE